MKLRDDMHKDDVVESPVMKSSPWFKILHNAFEHSERVSVIINGTYKPFTGYVLSIDSGLVTIDNEYSREYIMMSEIRSIRVYDERS